jgi:hypothetical protein
VPDVCLLKDQKLALFSKDTLAGQEKKEATSWVVRDPSSDTACADALKPSSAWDECRQCRQGAIYSNREEAARHVHQKHFRSRGTREKSRAIDDDYLARWVRDDQQYCQDQRLELYSTYIGIALEHLRECHSRAILLREGVARSDKATSQRYKLPSALLKAFENVVMLMMYTALSFQLVDSFCKRLEDHLESKNKDTHHQLLLTGARDNIDRTGARALLLMEKAEQDLMFMAYTEYDEGTVSYEAVGPEYLLATVMANVVEKPLHDSDSIDKIYASYYEKLVRLLKIILRMQRWWLIPAHRIQKQETTLAPRFCATSSSCEKKSMKSNGGYRSRFFVSMITSPC